MDLWNHIEPCLELAARPNWENRDEERWPRTQWALRRSCSFFLWSWKNHPEAQLTSTHLTKKAFIVKCHCWKPHCSLHVKHSTRHGNGSIIWGKCFLQKEFCQLVFKEGQMKAAKYRDSSRKFARHSKLKQQFILQHAKHDWRKHRRLRKLIVCNVLVWPSQIIVLNYIKNPWEKLNWAACRCCQSKLTEVENDVKAHQNSRNFVPLGMYCIRAMT